MKYCGMRGYASPGKYIQGYDALSQLGQYAADFGQVVYAVIDAFFYETFNQLYKKQFDTENLHLICEKFSGEITNVKLSALYEKAAGESAEVIIGIGGGKTMDTAKYIAAEGGLPLIIVPTAASSDAPTSALSVVYTEAGEHDKTIYFKQNPNLILVDSKIIARAPVRLLVAGMGDALSTYFEARAHIESGAVNRVKPGFKPTLAGYALAKLCYDALLENGSKAKRDVMAGLCTAALENILEVNILLSGIGVECVGCGAAHGYNSGFSTLSECRDYLHGEIVAFCTLCQLVLEDRPRSEIEEVLTFMTSVGLPMTLADIGLDASNGDALQRVAAKAATTEHIGAEPVYWDERILYESILSADAIGREWRKMI